jgi:predicted peptidase
MQGPKLEVARTVITPQFLKGRFLIDLDRIYVLGESSGAWSLAKYSPNHFAVVMPLCGYGDPEAAESVGDYPIWAFRCEQDNMIPVTEPECMVNAVAKVGGNARLTVLKGRGHDLRDLAWHHEALVEWMLNQRREVCGYP